MKKCCFTGHRKINILSAAGVIKDLKKTITSLYDEGVREFICGGALGFDTCAALGVLNKKRKGASDIRLVLNLPCKDQPHGWTQDEVNCYEYIKSQADKVVYISERYTSSCMLERNRHMVNNSDICVAYIRQNAGGTAYTVRYALSKKKRMIYIGNSKVLESDRQ